MLISQEINDAMNEQIGHEFGASLQYVAIAAYFEHENLPVLANRFYTQATEERDHAMRFVKYILNVGGRVQIPAIPAPKNEFASAEEAVRLSVDWEKTVTKQITDLKDLAVRHNDYLSQNFLEWFINEQIEEVSTMELLHSMVRRAGESGLLLVENMLAQQGFAPASEAAEGE